MHEKSCRFQIGFPTNVKCNTLVHHKSERSQRIEDKQARTKCQVMGYACTSLV